MIELYSLSVSGDEEQKVGRAKGESDGAHVVAETCHSPHS